MAFLPNGRRQRERDSERTEWLTEVQAFREHSGPLRKKVSLAESCSPSHFTPYHKGCPLIWTEYLASSDWLAGLCTRFPLRFVSCFTRQASGECSNCAFARRPFAPSPSEPKNATHVRSRGAISRLLATYTEDVQLEKVVTCMWPMTYNIFILTHVNRLHSWLIIAYMLLLEKFHLVQLVNSRTSSSLWGSADKKCEIGRVRPKSGCHVTKERLDPQMLMFLPLY